MNTPLPADEELERMHAAADWLVRLSEEPGNEELITEWFQWCQQHADNLPAFKKAQAVWQATAVSSAMEGENSAGRALSWRKWRVPLAWAAAWVIGIGTGSWFLSGKFADSGAQSYATPVASLGSSILPDGSRVELSARSRITTEYTPHMRRVSVDDGEAFFTVKKDPVRPFVVTAHGVSVTAIGTAFNVRYTPDRIVVTVREGRVRVAGDANSQLGEDYSAMEPVALEAGRQAAFVIPSRRVVVAQVPPAEAASWRQGVLKYENEPLSSVVADLGRYLNKKIVIADPELASEPFTGTILSAHISQALLALQDVFPLRVVQRGETLSLEPR